MSTETQQRTATEVAREAFHVLFVERDPEKARRFWTGDSVDHFLAAGETVRGGDALAAWFADLLRAFPDWTIEIENTFDDGDRQVVVQWHARGTFEGGPFLGIEPTGRPVELRGVDVFRFDDDWRVDSNTVYYDGAEFARQLGMLPPRESAPDRLMLRAFNARVRLARRVRARRGGAPA